MKVMDISVEDDGCTIEMVTPPKQKKLKQARLPFQILSTVDSPNSVSSKKRKLSSPSIECKSKKLIKFSKSTTSGNECTNSCESNGKILSDISVCGIEEEDKDSNSSDVIRDNLIQKSSPMCNEKRTDGNSEVKAGTLTKFLKKTEKSVKVDNDINEETEKGPENRNSPDKTEKHSCMDDDVNKSSKDSTSMDVSDIINLSSDSDDPNLSSEAEGNDEQERASNSSEKNENLADGMSTPESDKKNDLIKRRKLTPKQLERKLESAKKREEKEKLKMEKEKKRAEERANRRKQKEEKRKKKEEKEKADKEQKKKEKELKEMKKQMEIEQKQKEKEAKDEERRKREEAKEEERKRKEEEKLEAERKKQKEASNFASFFVAKKQEVKTAEESTNSEQKYFMPFEVKADMRIAPVCRRVLDESEKDFFERKFREGAESTSDLFLGEIKDKKIIRRKSGKTWPFEGKDVIIIDEEENISSSNVVDETRNPMEKQRVKLLQFAENRRPPYWGTWRKKSSSINPRRPFAKDSKWFDYEIDSDEEWEEEEPGESLRGSDDEKDEENPEDNEYDVDNEFMVPHGYLSDEEAQADEEDGEDMSPETQKFKLKILGEEFEAERNEKTSKLKPKIIGCIWQGSQNAFSENLPRRMVELLTARQAWVREIPVSLPSAPESTTTLECNTPTRQSVGSKKTKVPDEALPDLVRLIHGNTHGRRFLVKEFMAHWNTKNKGQLSKGSLSEKIRELAKWMMCPEEGPMHRKACWYVTEEIRKKNLPAEENVTLPNRWNYVLTPKRVSEVLDTVEKSDREEQERKGVPLITQFTKKITQEEMKKQLTTIPASTSKSVPQKAPKRATLISVGRGEQFSKASKETLSAKFVSTRKESEVGVVVPDPNEKDVIEIIE